MIYKLLFTGVLVLTPALSWASIICGGSSYVSFSQQLLQITVESQLGDSPIYDITMRPDSKNGLPYIEGSNTIKIFDSMPWTSFQPGEFFYQSDVRHGLPVFQVGGVNCHSVINSTKSITGVSLENLSLRARGQKNYGSYESRKTPEWKGVNQRNMRVSSEGFISRKFIYDSNEAMENPKTGANELRRLLSQDNRWVQTHNITHQQVSSPILTIIEQNTLHGKNEVIIEGVIFSVKVSQMGGAVDLISMQEDQKQASLKNSGWTGRGVQGSFFDDELFSNKLYEITNTETGKSLTIDGLTPHLMYRYGFYQGGEYRVEPQKVADFFKIQPKGNPWQKCSGAKK